MSKYGQFCPVAKSLDILGDRWTLLIVRELLIGTTHFNDLERGLPGISRTLLAQRLRQLQKTGVVEKRLNSGGRQSTEYRLTPAGRELQGVMGALMMWGEAWAFGEPEPEELDPVLLMWRLRADIRRDKLPPKRVVIQFDFRVPGKGNFWLILTTADVTLCLTDPGYEIDVLVTADLAAFYKLYWGRITYEQAILDYEITVEGMPPLVQAIPDWFAWSAARGIQAVRARRNASLSQHESEQSSRHP
jgi:DNA-binding HxlR family transcriptional regulator